MYSFEATGDSELSRDNIMRRVSEDILWRHYLGFNFTVGRTYKSPLREDPIPSFSIFEARRMGGKIMAKDHGGTFSGDVFDYVMFTERLDFYSAMVKVNNDFGLGLSYKIDKVQANIPYRRAVNVQVAPLRTPGIIYEVEHRPPTQLDIDHWLGFGITRNILRLYEVYCVNVLWCNGQCCYTYDPGNPCYQYRFRSGNSKFYWPLAAKGYKFRGNIDNDIDIQGYYQCSMDKENKGELLVLTKSLKDVMLLREYGIDAVAIHGENHRFNKDFMRHIKERYHRIVSLYDRDASGMKGARYLWKEFGIGWVFIPKGSGKDITDFYKLKGREKVDEFVQQRLRQYD